MLATSDGGDDVVVLKENGVTESSSGGNDTAVENDGAQMEEEVKRLQEKVRIQRIMLERLPIREGESTVPSLGFNKIIANVTSNDGGKQKKSDRLPPKDLLIQRLKNWSSQLYPKIREDHYLSLKILQLTEQMNNHSVVQALQWTKSLEKSESRSQSVLEYWSRQLGNWRKEYKKFKGRFEREHSNLKYGDDDSVFCVNHVYGEEAFLEFLDFTTIRNGIVCAVAIRFEDNEPETTCSLALEGLDEWVKECYLLEASVCILIQGIGARDRQGIWGLIDQHYGDAVVQYKEDLEVDASV